MALAAYKELLFIPRPSVVTWALLLPFLCSNPVWCINHRGCLLLFIVPRLFLSTRAARGLAFRARRLYTTRSERRKWRNIEASTDSDVLLLVPNEMIVMNARRRPSLLLSTPSHFDRKPESNCFHRSCAPSQENPVLLALTYDFIIEANSADNYQIYILTLLQRRRRFSLHPPNK